MKDLLELSDPSGSLSKEMLSSAITAASGGARPFTRYFAWVPAPSIARLANTMVKSITAEPRKENIKLTPA